MTDQLDPQHNLILYLFKGFKIKKYIYKYN